MYSLFSTTLEPHSQLSNLVFLFVPAGNAGEVDLPRSSPAITLSAALLGPTRPPAPTPGVPLRLDSPDAVAGTKSTDSLGVFDFSSSLFFEICCCIFANFSL